MLLACGCTVTIIYEKIIRVAESVTFIIYTNPNKREMRISMDNGKINRILDIYTKLIEGKLVNKMAEAQQYGVSVRTIQRDIDDIRSFLEEAVENTGIINNVYYNRSEKGYRLERNYPYNFNDGEILSICKIMLNSRALCKDEMRVVLNKLIECCVTKQNQKVVNGMIRNEFFHYIEPRHKTKLIDRLWEIAQAINNCHYIEINYERTKDKVIVSRKVKPVAIMFSEYYFYLTVYIGDEDVRKDFDNTNDKFPTIYRIDRIKSLKVLEEKFYISYSNRFEEGEYRKRIQFMYGGKLQEIKFKYKGRDIDAVLDKLPTAKVLGEENGVYTVSVEAFGKGIEMWLRSQGDDVVVIDNN